jgi:hypothetical protein
MQITCEGCGTVIEGESGDAVLTAMIAHGEEVHSNLFEGKSPDEVKQMQQMMEAHVRQMIADES